MISSTTIHAREHRNDILGWATESLIELDTLAPGLIRRVVTAPPLVRQTLFTVLAIRSLFTDGSVRVIEPNEEDRLMAEILRSERAREIFVEAFDRPAPDGLFGALERLGGRPMKSAMSYFGLLAIYENPANHRKVEALKYVGAINQQMLQITELVDERWCHHALLMRLESVEDAKDFNRAVAYAQAVNSRVTDEVVRESIARLKPNVPLARMVKRWVRRADRFPDQPVVRGSQLKPLATSREIIEAGYRFRNCMGLKGLDQVLIGAVAFLEFDHQGQSAILELRPLSDHKGWVLHECHVYRNGLVPDELDEAARTACSLAGISHVENGTKSLDWRAYRRFTRKERGPFGWAA